MWARIAAMVVAAGLAGCVASGVQVKEEQLAQFKQGETKLGDVTKALGAPNHQMPLPNGQRILAYSYAQIQTRPETFIPFVGAFVGGADMKTSSTTFTFDRNGILQSMTSSSGVTGSGMGLSSGTGAPERVPEQPRQAP